MRCTLKMRSITHVPYFKQIRYNFTEKVNNQTYAEINCEIEYLK